MNHKAQALISVFLLLIVVGIFVGVLGHMWPAEMQTRKSEKEGLKSFYLAQGALDFGKTLAEKNPAFWGWYPCADDSNANCWYRNSFGGWYKVKIINLGGNRRKIVGKAQEMDTSSSPARILSQRNLEVVIDLGTRAEEEWSWREWCPTCCVPTMCWAPLVCGQTTTGGDNCGDLCSRTLTPTSCNCTVTGYSSCVTSCPYGPYPTLSTCSSGTTFRMSLPVSGVCPATYAVCCRRGFGGSCSALHPLANTICSPACN